MTIPNRSKPNSKRFLDQLLEEEETQSSTEAPDEAVITITAAEATINGIIDKNVKELRKRHPSGGLRSTRVITSEVLIKAPKNYFKKFEEDVRKGTLHVQSELAQSGKSSLIAEAKNNPTNDAAQEEAYKECSQHIVDFLSEKVWRGVDRAVMISLITAEILGFSVIDPLWRDKRINEIMADGPSKIRIEIAGNKYNVPSCQFRDEAQLRETINKTLSPLNKNLSRTTPLVQGRLYDNSRLHAVDPVVAPAGPLLNIRRHKEEYWTPQDMVNFGAISEEAMTDIGNLIYKGCSFLVVGGTSTGKTTMLNALTGFYRDNIRVLTLEDSLEMKPHPKKMLAPGMECVPSRPGSSDTGITMRDLVRASLLMSPDVIILGEVKDGAAYDLCQALNTGHAGASTFHANTPDESVERLRSMVGQAGVVRAEATLPLIAAAFDFIVYLRHYPIDGSRRVSNIVEIPSQVSYNNGEGFLKMRELWKFENEKIIDNKIQGEWVKKNPVSDMLSERRGLSLTPDMTWEQLVEVSKV